MSQDKSTEETQPREATSFEEGSKGSVTYKILGIVGLLVAVMAGNAGYGIYQMGKIGGEIYEIAEHDLPLTEIVTNVTTHQLEQAIALQRSLRYGEEMLSDPDKRQLFDDTARRFQELGGTVKKEFVTAGEMVAAFIAAEDEGRELKEFEHVEEALKAIDKSHEAYEEHANSLLEQLKRGDVDAAVAVMESVEAEEASLDKELENLLSELEEFTLASARAAEEHETSALQTMIALATFGTIFAVLATVIMMRVNITRPLGEVVRARKSVV